MNIINSQKMKHSSLSDKPKNQFQKNANILKQEITDLQNTVSEKKTHNQILGQEKESIKK
jgi:hypothetical protein